MLSTAYVAQAFFASYQEELGIDTQRVEAAADNISAGNQQLNEDITSQQVTDTLKEIDFDVAADDSENAITDNPVNGQVNQADKKVAVNDKAKPAVNILKVSAMRVNSAVLEGKSSGTLDKGLWRIPGTSTPDKGGNTVISAHRWKWGPSSGKSFYDINKVSVGDQIELTWQGKLYVYKVSNIQTVTPDKVEILSNTAQPKLTLFSCAPLFSSKYRLVVEADLIS